jgi:hypothetical protein
MKSYLAVSFPAWSWGSLHSINSFGKNAHSTRGPKGWTFDKQLLEFGAVWASLWKQGHSGSWKDGFFQELPTNWHALHNFRIISNVHKTYGAIIFVFPNIHKLTNLDLKRIQLFATELHDSLCIYIPGS